jgi:hypothetical protein
MGRNDGQVQEGVTATRGGLERGNVDGTGQLADGRAAVHSPVTAATMRADGTVTFLYKMLQVMLVVIMGLL